MRILKLGTSTTTIKFGKLEDAVSELPRYSGLLVCDENTLRYAREFRTPLVEIASGETNKRWEGAQKILCAALEHELTRDGVIAAIGGGVLCDMSGFAASVYMRGCRLVLVPTTLLAMIDASIGGKTGIDFEGYKNLIGTFYPAETVHISVDVLSTLAQRQYMSGLVEAIKHAMLGDAELLAIMTERRNDIVERAPELIERIVMGSLDVKGDIVERDLEEAGIRAHLNLGHTFGHALESITGFARFTHGEAVAWGIGRALKLGLLLGITDDPYARSMWRLLERYGFELGDVGVAPQGVLDLMKTDKKRKENRLRCIVQRRQGETEIVEPDDSGVMTVLSDHSRLE